MLARCLLPGTPSFIGLFKRAPTAGPPQTQPRLLYNDAEGKAMLVLFDGEGAVAQTREVWSSEGGGAGSGSFR